jgi:hypothetical protein
MSLPFLLDRFHALPATRALVEALPVAGGRLPLGGLPGSSPALLVATLARCLVQRVFAVVAPTPADAERWLADLRTVCDDGVVRFRNARAGVEEPHVETLGARKRSPRCWRCGAHHRHDGLPVSAPVFLSCWLTRGSSWRSSGRAGP